MATFLKTDPDCGSPEQMIFVGNVRLDNFTEPEAGPADLATAALTIDVIASLGNELRPFQFVTLILQILAPDGARFVDHTGRGNFHWDVLADPATTTHAFEPPDADVLYWAEDVDTAAPTSTLRIREDMTNLLSSPGNGRTYAVGIAGVSAEDALQIKALASACDARTTSCELTIADLHTGDALPGYIG